jgi:O-antigen/teichoic acid export membrane protein
MAAEPDPATEYRKVRLRKRAGTLRERYRRSLAGRSWGTAIVSWTGAALSFLLGLIFARALGANAYGAYSYAMGWALLLAIPAGLGYERFLLRELAALRATKDWTEMARLVRHSNIAVTLTGMAIGAGGAMVGAVLLHQPFRVAFLIAMTLVPIIALISLRRGVLQALGSPELAQIPEQVVRPVIAAVAVLGGFALAGHRLSPAAASVAALIAGLVSLLVANRNSSRRLPAEVVALEKGATGRFKFTPIWSFLFLNILFQGNFQIPQLVLGGTGQAAEVAYYTIAAMATNLTVMVLNGVNVTLAPRMSTFYSEGRIADLQRVTTLGTRIAFFCSLALMGIVVAVRMPILGLYGSDFKAASSPLLILLIGQFVNIAVGPAAIMLMMAHRQNSVTIVGAIGSALSLVIALILCGNMGADGAAIAATANLVFWNVVLAVVARVRVGINTTIFARRT